MESGSVELTVDQITGYKKVNDITESMDAGSTGIINDDQGQADSSFDVPAAGVGYYLVPQVDGKFKYSNLGTVPFVQYSSGTRAYYDLDLRAADADGVYQVRKYQFEVVNGETTTVNTTFDFSSSGACMGTGLSYYSSNKSITLAHGSQYRLWLDYANSTLGAETLATLGALKEQESQRSVVEKPAMAQWAPDNEIEAKNRTKTRDDPKKVIGGSRRVYFIDQEGYSNGAIMYLSTVQASIGGTQIEMTYLGQLWDNSHKMWYADVPTGTGALYVQRRDGNNKTTSIWNYSANSYTISDTTNAIWASGYKSDGDTKRFNIEGSLNTYPYFSVKDGANTYLSWNANTARFEGTFSVSSGTEFGVAAENGGAHKMGVLSSNTGVAGLSKGSKYADQNYHEVFYFHADAPGTVTITVGSGHFLTYGDPSYDWSGDGSTSTISFAYARYDITYKDKGNSTFSGTHEAGYPTTHTYGTATTLKEASKDGYTFGGWFTNSACTGTAVTSLGATDYTANITLYAKWTANEYTITYKDQGDEVFSGTHAASHPTAHTYGTDTTLKSASKTGYSFGGWFTNSACTGTAVTSLGANDYTANITLYAKWTAKTSTLSFDLNTTGSENDVTTGSTTASPTAATYGESLPILSGIPTRTYNGPWVFLGYWDAAVNGNQYYNANLTPHVLTWNKDVITETTLYAHWSQDKFTLAYNGGGSTSGSQASVTDNVVGASTNIVANPFTKTGYHFVGWNAYKAYGTEDVTLIESIETEGLVGTSVDFDPNNIANRDIVTLVAQWEADTYTITYKDQGNANFSGSHSSTPPTSHTYGVEDTKLNSATKTGYTFGGWFTNSSCTGDSVSSLGATEFTDDITLYAKWAANNYTVTYVLNGGDALDPATKSVTYDSAYGTLPAPTRTGYDFAGWYLEAEFTHSVTSETTVSTAENHNIYADWTPKTYTVDLDKNDSGASAGTTSVTATYNATMPTLATAPTKEGYDFLGYFDDPSSGTKYYNADKRSAHIWDKVVSTTLYAHWQIKTYQISFDLTPAGYGSLSATSISNVPHFSTISVSDNTVTIAGTTITATPTAQSDEWTYSFAGWNVSNGATISGAITITATFAREHTVHTITLNNHDGTGDTSVDATYGSAPENTTAPTRDGYVFLGYYSEQDGAGTVYYDFEGNSLTTNYDASVTTLHAYWLDTATAATKFVAGETYYLIVGGHWSEGGERYVAYLYNASGSVWLDLDLVSSGVYSFTIPNGKYNGLIFARMEGDSDSNSFTNPPCWNQSVDMFKGTGGRDYTNGHYYCSINTGKDGKKYTGVWTDMIPGDTTVYFHDVDSWGDIQVHYWLGGTEGEADMDSLGDGYYNVVLPSGSWEGLVFWDKNNPGSNKTPNVTTLWSSANDVCYDKVNSAWGWHSLPSKFEGGTNIYLNLNGVWGAEPARYAIYLYGPSAGTGTWASLTAAQGTNDYYYATLPQGNWFRVIFCRMNNTSGHEANNWDNRWNQTADLIYSPSTPTYFLDGSMGNEGAGSWTNPPFKVTQASRKILLGFDDGLNEFTGASPVVVLKLSDGGSAVTYILMTALQDQNGDVVAYLALLDDYLNKWWFTIEYYRVNPNNYVALSPASQVASLTVGSQIWNIVTPGSLLSGTDNNCYYIKNTTFTNGDWGQKIVKNDGYYLVGSTTSTDPTHPLIVAGSVTTGIVDGVVKVTSTWNLENANRCVTSDENNFAIWSGTFLPGDTFTIVYVSNYTPYWYGYRATVDATTNAYRLFSYDESPENDDITFVGTYSSYTAEVYFAKVAKRPYVYVDSYVDPTIQVKGYSSTLSTGTCRYGNDGSVVLSGTTVNLNSSGNITSLGSAPATKTDSSFTYDFKRYSTTNAYDASALGESVPAGTSIYAIYWRQTATITIDALYNDGTQAIPIGVTSIVVDKGVTLDNYSSQFPTVSDKENEYGLLYASAEEGALYAFRAYEKTSNDNSTAKIYSAFTYGNPISFSDGDLVTLSSVSVNSDTPYYLKAQQKDAITFYLDANNISEWTIHVTDTTGHDFFVFGSDALFRVAKNLYKLTMPLDYGFLLGNGVNTTDTNGHNWVEYNSGYPINTNDRSGSDMLLAYGSVHDYERRHSAWLSLKVTPSDGAATIIIAGEDGPEMGYGDWETNYFISESGTSVRTNNTVSISVDSNTGIDALNGKMFGLAEYGSDTLPWYLTTDANDEVVVNIDSELGWDSVWAYAWDSSDETDTIKNKAFPGEQMTAGTTANGYTTYTIDLDFDLYDKVIFSNGYDGNANQTDSLDLKKYFAYTATDDGDNVTSSSGLKEGNIISTVDAYFNFYVYKISGVFKWSIAYVPSLGNGYYIMKTGDNGDSTSGYRGGVKMITDTDGRGASYSHYYVSSETRIFVRSYLSGVDSLVATNSSTSQAVGATTVIENARYTGVITLAAGYYSVVVSNGYVVISGYEEQSFFTLNAYPFSGSIYDAQTALLLEIKVTLKNNAPMIISATVNNSIGNFVGYYMVTSTAKIGSAYDTIRDALENDDNDQKDYEDYLTTGSSLASSSGVIATSAERRTDDLYVYILIDYIDVTNANFNIKKIADSLSFVLVATQQAEGE